MLLNQKKFFLSFIIFYIFSSTLFTDQFFENAGYLFIQQNSKNMFEGLKTSTEIFQQRVLYQIKRFAGKIQKIFAEERKFFPTTIQQLQRLISQLLLASTNRFKITQRPSLTIQPNVSEGVDDLLGKKGFISSRKKNLESIECQKPKAQLNKNSQQTLREDFFSQFRQMSPKKNQPKFSLQSLKHCFTKNSGNFGLLKKKHQFGLPSHSNSHSLSKSLQEQICKWIKQKSQKGQGVSRKMVRQKAKKLYGSEQFQATKGWLRRFVQRHPYIREYFVHQKSKGLSNNLAESGTQSEEEGEWQQIQEHERKEIPYLGLVPEKKINLNKEDYASIFENFQEPPIMQKIQRAQKQSKQT